MKYFTISYVKTILKAMRLHQWSKNALLAVILFLNLPDLEGIWIVWLLVAFLAFSFVASALYLVNDIYDADADRNHPNKRNRPFAKGDLNTLEGIILAVVLGIMGFGCSLALSVDFSVMLLAYAAISATYTFYLKWIPILDTIILSLLYCWRILSGGVLIESSINYWFMLAMGAFFLALALGKRAVELYNNQDLDELCKIRGYMVKDLYVVIASGMSSSFLCVVIVLIYALLSKSAVIENQISAVIIGSILTFWQMRFWLLVGRGEVHEDPIIFTLKDRQSLAVIIMLGLVVIYEQFWAHHFYAF